MIFFISDDFPDTYNFLHRFFAGTRLTGRLGLPEPAEGISLDMRAEEFIAWLLCDLGSRSPDRRIVIVEFPSMERVRQWYASPAYAEALKYRRAALERRHAIELTHLGCRPAAGGRLRGVHAEVDVGRFGRE